MERVKIGVLGTGAISGIYFQNLTELFREVEVRAVCDLFQEKARDVYKRQGFCWAARRIRFWGRGYRPAGGSLTTA